MKASPSACTVDAWSAGTANGIPAYEHAVTLHRTMVGHATDRSRAARNGSRHAPNDQNPIVLPTSA